VSTKSWELQSIYYRPTLSVPIRPIPGIRDAEMAVVKQPVATAGRLSFRRMNAYESRIAKAMSR
jgi:hypothetical protein